MQQNMVHYMFMVYLMLYKLLNFIFQGLYLLLLVRVLLSWIPHNPYNTIIQFIYSTTEPILRPFQSILPTWKIGIDLSPLFAFIALGIVRDLLFQLIF